MYNTILRFVDKEIEPIMDAAEQIGTKRSATVTTNGHANPELTLINVEKSEESFDILANVLWAEVARGVMDDLGSAVFAVGRADEFRRVCYL